VVEQFTPVISMREVSEAKADQVECITFGVIQREPASG